MQFEFLGTVNGDGSFHVEIHPIQIEAVRKRAGSEIEFADAEEDFPCSSEWHTDRCQRVDGLCIYLQKEKAARRLKKLYSLDLLTECVRNPSSANGERTLEGIASESVVYETR